MSKKVESRRKRRRRAEGETVWRGMGQNLQEKQQRKLHREGEGQKFEHVKVCVILQER